MVPLLNELFLNVVKVFSISIAVGVAKAILISLSVIFCTFNFLVCTFVFFKSMIFKSLIRLLLIDAEFQEMFDQHSSETSMSLYTEVDTSLPVIDLLVVE